MYDFMEFSIMLANNSLKLIQITNAHLVITTDT